MTQTTRPAATSGGNTSPANAITAGGTGLHGEGYNVPAGSLDIYRAGRDASASTLCECVAFGDSLTRGEGPSAGLYSFLQRLRERSTGAGFLDGGRGYNNTVLGETLDSYGGELAPIAARSGFALAESWGMPYSSYSNAAGDTVTFKVQASRARLWWSRFNAAGRFSYAVNGGSPVTVLASTLDAPPRGAGTGVTSLNPEMILLGAADGMTPTGTNTIVVTNVATDPASARVAVNIEAINDTGIVWHNHGNSGANIQTFFGVDDLFFNNQIALSALGVQWGLSTNGIPLSTVAERLPSALASGVSAPQDPATARTPRLVLLAFGTNDSRVDWNLDTPPAGSAVVGGVGTIPAGTYYYKFRRHIPSSPSSGLGPASPTSAGVTVNGSQQVAVTTPASPQGLGYPPTFSVYRATSAGGTYSLVGQAMGFGVQYLDNLTNVGPAMSADYGAVLTGHAVLVDQIVHDLSLGIQIARNAGANPLVILPTMLLLSQGGANRGVPHLVKNAIRAAADTYSVPWVDWDIALGPSAGRLALGYGPSDTNPHIRKPAYQAQGDFLWDNVLSL